MKTQIAAITFIAALALLAGCSTVESRVASHRASYQSWPPAVQQRVSAGQIDVGFTTEQVRVALGDPDMTFTRTAPNGTFEVWSYRERGPRFSFGVGVGSFGSHSGFSTGVGMSSGPAYPGERMRVIFDPAGRVTQIEQIRHRR